MNDCVHNAFYTFAPMDLIPLFLKREMMSDLITITIYCDMNVGVQRKNWECNLISQRVLMSRTMKGEIKLSECDHE